MSTAGRLRPNVLVDFQPEQVTIAFGPWETRLPREWVDGRPEVANLLNGRSTLREGLADADAGPVAKLLAAQGCFVPDLVTTPVSLVCIRALFEPIKLEWYASYYSHPLWNALRSGAATRAELVGWIIHNYHVSRAAGIVAARAAISHRRWRRFFEIDAIEEFWHCDAFYFIDAPDLRVPGRDVRTYVPLPASLAFEQLCLVTAERDPVGHLLIAYFQEASIMFRSDSDTFYCNVEQAYGIDGFFRTWRQHIQIDVDHGHADGLAQLFDTDWHVPPDQLAAALRNAWLAFYFLLASLDDVRGQAGPSIALRHPFTAPSHVASIADLASWCAALHSLPANTAERVADLVPFVRATALRALGFARDHDAVMLTGGIVRTLDGACDTITDRPWTIEVGNFLAEVAVDMRRWYAAIRLLAARCALPDEVGRLLAAYEKNADLTCSRRELDRHATELHQFNELVERSLTSSEVIPATLTNWIRP